MLEGHILQNNDRVLGGILLQQGLKYIWELRHCILKVIWIINSYLKVWRTSWQDHLVGFAGLAVTGQCHVGKRLLVPQVLEWGDHVGLEVIPSETKLLLVTLCHFWCLCDLRSKNWRFYLPAKIKTNFCYWIESWKILDIFAFQALSRLQIRLLQF